ncbi:MAG: hypothetical protein ACRDQ2_18090 [Gaiellales bacterium]
MGADDEGKSSVAPPPQFDYQDLNERLASLTMATMDELREFLDPVWDHTADPAARAWQGEYYTRARALHDHIRTMDRLVTRSGAKRGYDLWLRRRLQALGAEAA